MRSGILDENLVWRVSAFWFVLDIAFGEEFDVGGGVEVREGNGLLIFPEEGRNYRLIGLTNDGWISKNLGFNLTVLLKVLLFFDIVHTFQNQTRVL